MEASKLIAKQSSANEVKELYFDVSTGLKRVLGRELITDDEVAIFELVKNSFDAGAKQVQIYFGTDDVIVADNGSGMWSKDLNDKWLFVAYSAKREQRSERDFRDVAADRGHYAGSKGIGRFSSDRLGGEIVLQTRPKSLKVDVVHRLLIDWQRFDADDKEQFGKVPVVYSETKAFELPDELRKFGDSLEHGTIIEIRKLKHAWNRARILDLKSSLAKLINPFGDKGDHFSIYIVAPAEVAGDKQVSAEASKTGEGPLAKDIVNGLVGNFIFSELQEKTTFIRVEIAGEKLNTTLVDRSEVVYKFVSQTLTNNLKILAFLVRCYI